jgi:hypothetical protein
MRVKVLYYRLRLLTFLQTPNGVVHRVAEDHGIRIEGNKAATRMSRYGDRKDEK